MVFAVGDETAEQIELGATENDSPVVDITLPYWRALHEELRSSIPSASGNSSW